MIRTLIAGGGIGGLAAAIALRQVGHDVTVVEQAPKIEAVGAGISLWANALHALERLGVLDQVPEGFGGPMGGIREASGRYLSRMSLPARENRSLLRTVHRADLHAVLRDALPSDVLQTNARCVDVQQDEDGVTARLENGTSLKGEFLIGADGIRSVVRSVLHGDAAPRYSGYTAWRAVVHTDVSVCVPAETWGVGARFGILPLDDHRVYWFATQNQPAGERAAGSEKSHLLKHFGHWHAPIQTLIEAAPEVTILRNDVYDRPPLRRWGQGRMTVLGDAAHPMTPNMGQGACQALEDAVVLGDAFRTRPTEAALHYYEQQRLPRTRTLVHQSWRIGQVGQMASPAGVWLRNRLMRLMPAFLQRASMEQVIWHKV